MIGKREDEITHINILRIAPSTLPLNRIGQKLSLSLNFLARRSTGSNLRLFSPVHTTYKARCTGAHSLSPSGSNSNDLKRMKMIVTNYNLQAVDAMQNSPHHRNIISN